MEASCGSSPRYHDSRLCWHVLQLALPSPPASVHPGECVCVSTEPQNTHSTSKVGTFLEGGDTLAAF